MKNRLMYDPGAIAYAQRRTAEGMGEKAIKRVLKRYVARAIFRHLEAVMA